MYYISILFWIVGLFWYPLLYRNNIGCSLSLLTLLYLCTTYTWFLLCMWFFSQHPAMLRWKQHSRLCEHLCREIQHFLPDFESLSSQMDQSQIPISIYSKMKHCRVHLYCHLNVVCYQHCQSLTESSWRTLPPISFLFPLSPAWAVFSYAFR